MKKILLFIALVCGLVACSQTPPGYTKISARYDWLAGKFDSGLHVPGYATTPNIRTGVWVGSGNVGIDTVAHTMWFYSDGWRSVGAGGYNSNIGSGFRWAVPNTNNIKTVFSSNTIIWDSSSNANGLTPKADTAVLATQYDLTQVPSANIYNSDGTLTGNRTVDQSTFILTFQPGTSNSFLVQSDGANGKQSRLNINGSSATLQGAKSALDTLSNFVATYASAQIYHQDNSSARRILVNNGGISLESDVSNSLGLYIALNGGLLASPYGAGTFTGTPTYNLAVDASGNIIEVASGGGTPSLTATQIGFGDVSNLMTSSADFVYDVAGLFQSVFTAGNDTRFIQNDASQTLTYQKGADIFFSTTVATGTEAGFWGNPGGNLTSVAWDDATKLITLTAGGGVYITNTISTTQNITQLATSLTIDAAGISNSAIVSENSFTVDGDAGSSQATGVMSILNANATAVIGTYVGFDVAPTNTAAGATINIFEGFAVDGFTNEATIGDFFAYYYGGVTLGAGTINNNYGLWLGDVAGGTTVNYAIYTNKGDISLGNGNTNGTAFSLADAAQTIAFTAANGMTLNGNPFGGNIYTEDGTVTGTRNVDLDNNILQIGSGASIPILINPTTFVTNLQATDATGNVELTLNSDVTGNLTASWTLQASDGVGGNAVISGDATAATITLTAANGVLVTTGIIRGDALHDNAFAQGDATQQDVRSGTYTPTLTNVTNIAASTAFACQWIRVGNVVTVSGKVNIDVTLGVASELGMSLPITSAMTADENLGGTASSAAAASLVSAIRADATNDRAAFVFTAVSLTNDSYAFEFTYLIK